MDRMHVEVVVAIRVNPILLSDCLTKEPDFSPTVKTVISNDWQITDFERKVQCKQRGALMRCSVPSLPFVVNGPNVHKQCPASEH